MNNAIQTILDFVEGRITAKDFEQQLYHDGELEALLMAESDEYRGTYLNGTPFHYLIGLNYDDPGDAFDAQGALELVLRIKRVAFKPVEGIYKQLITAQPKWLRVDPAYIKQHILPGAGDLVGQELRDWLKKRLRQLFRYYKKPPWWIQRPAWPINANGPLYFLGQIKLENCELFHDEAAVYVFLDPATGQIETVVQVF